MTEISANTVFLLPIPAQTPVLLKYAAMPNRQVVSLDLTNSFG